MNENNMACWEKKKTEQWGAMSSEQGICTWIDLYYRDAKREWGQSKCRLYEDTGEQEL